MFRLNLGKKKTLLLFIRPSFDTVEYAIAVGSDLVKSSSCTFEELKQIAKDEKIKYARISFLTELSYFDKTTVRVKSKKFINLAVRKYINDQAIFVDSFVFKSKILKSAEQHLVGVCAIPEDDLKFIDKLKETFIVEYLLPVEVALFNLAKRLNEKVKSVVWVKDDFQINLTIDDNFIVNKSISSYVSEEIEPYAEDEILFNQKNHPLAHLEGLLYPDKECDFLPADYVGSVISYELARLSLGFSVIIFVILSTLSYVDYTKYSKLLAEFKRKSDLLNSKIAYINTHMPSQDEIEALNKIYQFVNEEENELDLGGFLSWITRIVPSNSVIVMLDIKRSGLNNQGDTEESPSFNPESESQQPAYQQNLSGFTVRLKLKIKGSYVEAKSSAKEFVKSLSEKVKPKDSRFEYDKSNSGATLYTQFEIKGRVKWQSL
ncbi:hypothetical protein [Hippea alviniae]|uniref:hypothetical protein n=1 Tax=Hippea alviniae TaxID=1279027 RepID=UPI0003B5E944|nr:hypothetical protein [Hippea alviniae]